VNAVVSQMTAVAGVTERGLICAPVDGLGMSQLEDLGMRSWAQIHESARAVAGGLQAAGVAPGDAVAVLAGTPGEIAALVQGIWMSGAAVTMVHHPTHRSDLSAWVADTAAVVKGVGASTLVVGSPFESAIEPLTASAVCRCLPVADLMSGPAGRTVTSDDGDVAMLQLTSGSTGRPRAVSITYRNLEANIRAIAQASQLNVESDTTVSWLPLFHDMGMTGFLLFPMYHGTNAVVVTPGDFLADPLLWPELISRYRGTMTAAPNFAYDLAARRLHAAADRAYDLSCVRFALSGGERIDPATIERFLAATARFGMRSGAIVPAYGMAEATLAISFTRPGEAYRVCARDPGSAAAEEAEPPGRVALGRPLQDCELRVVAQDGAVLAAMQVGEFQIRGANVTAGYRTEVGFEAACDADGWLATGDLGYLTDDGQAVICGRSKDALVISGRTVSPEDVESAVSGVAGVRAGGVAAVRVLAASEPEGFVLVIESEAHDDPEQVGRIRSDAAARVFETLGLTPRKTYVVAPGWIPKTSSGKLRRTEAARRLPQEDSAGDKAAPERKGGPPVGIVECWVADVWQVLLKIDRPGRLDRFTDLGGDSLAAVEFSRMVNEQFGVSMSVDRFAARQTIAAVVADLQPGSGEQRSPVVRLRTDDSGPVYLLTPGSGGHAWVFSALSDALSGPCDVLALSLMDLSSKPVEQLRAAVRWAALEAVQHHAAAGRPIVVAGYSFGALVAADLACWLAEHSVPIAALLLIDPQPLEAHSRRFDVRSAASSTIKALKRRRLRAPGILSPAALKLDDDIEVAYGKLRKAYLNGTVRLPIIPVAWLQSTDMMAKQGSAPMVFGTPVSLLDKEVIVSTHLDLMTGDQTARVAEWCERHVPRSAAPKSVAAAAPVHLQRDGFDPVPALGKIRESAGVETVTTPFGATAYLVTRHADVKAVLSDPRRFANSPLWAVGATDADGGESGTPRIDLKSRAGNLLSMDPPEHTRLRHMLMAQFTGPRMKRLEPRVHEIVEQHLGDMERSGAPADLIASFALPIPSLVICELLGVPYAERDSFQSRTGRQLDVSTPLAEQVTLERECRDHMAGLVAAARRNPGDDIIGMMVRDYGTDVTDDELVGIATLVLQAGHETTAHMLGVGVLALLMYPDQLAVVRDDPDAVAPAIEEMLRWLSVFQTSPWARFTTTDVEVAGVQIPAGRPVLFSLMAANRDPAAIDDPDTFDVRRGPTRHLAFGYGPHYCLGAPLARMEMMIAFPALLRRFPRLALAEPFENLAFRPSHFIYGLESLKVTW
jgi:fatty-acyl-CoA synthase